MNEAFRKQMEENGADVETTLKRFMGKEELYLKFIMKFQDDNNLEALLSSLDAQDYEGVFHSAHTLKGVAGNLGLNPVYDGASQICELLRGKQPQDVDVDKLSELKDRLEETYNSFQKIIAQNK